MEGSAEDEGGVRMEVEMVEMTEELLGEVSEAAVKVAGEAEKLKFHLWCSPRTYL